MNSANPITIDDKVYDKLTVNLAVSTNYNAAGERDMSIALRVVPTFIDNEGVHTADSSAYTVYRGRISELQTQQEVDCVATMVGALQNFIASKGW